MKKRKFGVRAKLLAFILPVVALEFFALIMIVNVYSRNMLEQKTTRLLEAETGRGINSIHAWNNDVIATLNTASSAMKSMAMTNEEMLKYEKSFLNKYKAFPNGIYVTCDDGTVIDAFGWEPEGDTREGSWYVDGVSHATMAFGEPYMDTYTGNYVVTASQWVDRVGGKGMVVAADVTLDVLSEVVNNMEVEGNGRSVLYKDMGKNSGR